MSLCLTGSVGGRSSVWPLQGASLSVGRSSRSGVQIPDPTVSKEHAEITRRDERWVIRDLGSRNGTRVNGVDALEPIPLAEGDLVEVGSVLLRVAAERVEAATQFSPSPGLGSTVKLAAQDFLGRSAPSGEAAARMVHVLAEAGRVLVLPRPLAETCEKILELVERAVPASRLVVLLRDAPGAEPVQIAARSRGGSAREPLALSRAILSTVLDECTSVVISDARHDPRFQARQSIIAAAIHSAMAVPLFDNERVLGLLYADTRDFDVTFGQEHLEVLTLLANMAAVKITNARLLEAEQARARMAQELATAARIQRGLLPPEPPVLDGWEIDDFLESCYEVGGDLYDFHLRPDGKLLFVAGDVVGKGMGAALLMSSFLASARVLYEACPEPGVLATRLGALLEREAERGRFVTGVVACLDPRTGRLEYVNAGHPPPCVIDASGLRRLESTGPPFGVVAGVVYEPGVATIAPGELLALYSDGLPEAQHGDEFFDEERLASALRESYGLPLAEARRRVIERVKTFQAETPRGDDLTLLLIRRGGSAVTGASSAGVSESEAAVAPGGAVR